MTIIALAGRKGAGKDTAGAAYVRSGYVLLKFADPLKEMLRTLFRLQGADEALIERMIEGDLKEEPTIYLNGKTPRWAMQSIGTEWGRNCISETLWVDIFLRRAALHPNVVVTDCRFPNEVDAVQGAGGRVIRIERTGLSKDNSHPSETLIDELVVDAEIVNHFDSAEAFADFVLNEVAHAA